HVAAVAAAVGSCGRAARALVRPGRDEPADLLAGHGRVVEVLGLEREGDVLADPELVAVRYEGLKRNRRKPEGRGRIRLRLAGVARAVCVHDVTPYVDGLRRRTRRRRDRDRYLAVRVGRLRYWRRRADLVDD